MKDEPFSSHLEERAKSSAWCEDQYDLRRHNRPLPEIAAEWAERSAGFRSRHGNYETVAYGPDEREVLDIYRAKPARGLLLFYHGGYWRSGSKDEQAWLAEHFLEMGLSVAIPNYPLCPNADIPTITSSALRAFAYVYKHLTSPEERNNIIVSGHSAGAYLAAQHVTTDWAASGLPVSPIHSLVSISGLFDLSPLVHTPMNQWLNLNVHTTQELDLRKRLPLGITSTMFAYGDRETAEFARQSHEIRQLWKRPDTDVLAVPGKGHFDILDDFAQPSCVLHDHVKRLLEKPPERTSQKSATKTEKVIGKGIMS